jgi:hypothetical protein
MGWIVWKCREGILVFHMGMFLVGIGVLVEYLILQGIVSGWVVFYRL